MAETARLRQTVAETNEYQDKDDIWAGPMTFNDDTRRFERPFWHTDFWSGEKTDIKLIHYVGEVVPNDIPVATRSAQPGKINMTNEELASYNEFRDQEMSRIDDVSELELSLTGLKTALRQ